MTTNDTTNSSKTRVRRLGRFGLSLACLLALVVLAGAAWGTAMLVAHQPATHNATHVVQWYQDPMHPWLVSPHPGPAPDCGMPMVPLDMAHFASDIAVDPATVQNIGIETTPAKRGAVVRMVRALGTVQYDETHLYDINTRAGGWVTRLHVDSVGQVVHKGEALFEIDSPELYSAKQEFVISHGAGDGEPGDPGRRSRTRSGPAWAASGGLLDAARAKLAYLGLSDAQIAALAKSGQAKRGTMIYSPYDGVVVQKDVIQGGRIKGGALLYRIADLSRVWVIASVYESQLPQVHAGQAATMTLSYLPGETFQGKVDYVYPYLDAASHQAKVRLVFVNPKGVLKPGMFARVTIEDQVAAEATLVPRSAVLDTGERQMLFVSTGQGHFQPRQVVVGTTSGDGWVAILKGVTPGEQVVTQGQFLLDSESVMREALAGMMGGEREVKENRTHKDIRPSPSPSLSREGSTDMPMEMPMHHNHAVHGGHR